MKNKLLTVVVLGIAAWVLLFFGCFAFDTSESNEPQRLALLKTYEHISVGATVESVLQSYWKNRSERLVLQAEFENEWMIRTPYEWGAGNWVIRIAFTSNHVSAIRIRTFDGPKPLNSPPDKLLTQQEAGVVREPRDGSRAPQP